MDEVMGMTLIRLRPEEISPDAEPLQGRARALTVVHSLSGPDDDEDPFLIGFLMHGDGLLRLYVQRTDRAGIIGADIRLTKTPATAHRLPRRGGAVSTARARRPALRSTRRPDQLVGPYGTPR
ncbi:hypothetical protein [Streptomyces sp. NPDC048508]|uniref:hypothetical protein n=1 Tax=Streptomyces sp. NPDC048508 TaxID=3365561 RepID=UPI003715C69B